MKKGAEDKVPMTPKTGIPKVDSLRPPSKPIKFDLKDKKKINAPMTPQDIQVEILPNATTSSAPTNPFQIDLVLDTLFTFVKRRDLPACRLASTNWNLKVIQRFREEFEIYVCAVTHPKSLPNPNHKEFRDGCKPKKDRSLESFVKLMRASLRIPYTKFRLDLNGEGNYRNQFFRVCGPIMTHVTLQNWTFEPDPFFQRAPSYDYFLIENLKEMFKFSRSLKSLRFHTPMFLHKNPTIQLFDNGLTRNLPTLEILSFRDFKWRLGKAPAFIDELIGQTDLFTALVTPKTASQISSLTTDSYRIQSCGFLDRMEQCGVKLKRLFITASDLYDPAPLYRLIELQKDNLLEFTCKLDGKGRRFCWNGRDGGPELPRMSRLKVLRIHTEDSRRFSIGCFYEKFPNLEILSWYNGYRVLDLDFLGTQCCPKLNSMNLHYHCLHEKGFARMSKIYSSTLTSLKINSGPSQATPKILGLIWTHLINLKELELKSSLKNFSGNFDSLFTGISPENCVKIQNDPTFWNFMCAKGNSSEKREKLRELTHDSSIANLKNLNRVSLKFPGVGLTDITGYLGLYLLENLKHVHIDFCEFTQTCCEELKKEMKLASWVFRATNGSYDENSSQILETKEIIPPCSYRYKEKEYLFGL